MMLTLLMLAQAATAAPPPPPQGSSQPIVVEGEKSDGSIRAELTITKYGTVSACKIVQSSGKPDLDDLACSGLMNARFTPAKDDSGKQIEGHYVTPRIIFKLGQGNR